MWIGSDQDLLKSNSTSGPWYQTEREHKHHAGHQTKAETLKASSFKSHLSSQSLNLGGRRYTTDDVATRTFYPFLSSAALRQFPTSFPFISWCYLPISSSVFLSFLLLSLSPAELSSPCQMILRCGHTIWVSISLPWLDHHSLQLHTGFCCGPPHSSHGPCRKCSEVSYSISSQGLGSLSRFLLSRSSSHRHKGRWIRWVSASA